MNRLATVALIAALPASAQDMRTMEVASSLGSILAAESFCGLSYDQAAVAAYIDNHVPADDMSFTSTLSVMVAGAEYSQQELSASSKTAHCRSVERTAQHFGFIE